MSKETILLVWQRWGGSSVISGENNPMLLCVTTYNAPNDMTMPTRDDLILLTSREAQSLGRLSNERRIAAFPPAVRAQMEPQGNNEIVLQRHGHGSTE